MGGGGEIKGENSSEITELFIFPALILWAFEASTLMYLDILGPSVTGGHPIPSAWAQPPKGTSVPSAAAAPRRPPVEPFEVGAGGVYARARHWRGSCPGWGWAGGGAPPSLTSLFIWEPEWPSL